MTNGNDGGPAAHGGPNECWRLLEKGFRPAGSDVEPTKFVVKPQEIVVPYGGDRADAGARPVGRDNEPINSIPKPKP